MGLIVEYHRLNSTKPYYLIKWTTLYLGGKSQVTHQEFLLLLEVRAPEGVLRVGRLQLSLDDDVAVAVAGRRRPLLQMPLGGVQDLQVRQRGAARGARRQPLQQLLRRWRSF